MIRNIYFLGAVVFFVIEKSLFAMGQQHNFSFFEVEKTGSLPLSDENNIDDDNEGRVIEMWTLGCQIAWPELSTSCKHFIQSAVVTPSFLMHGENFDVALGCMDQKTLNECNQYGLLSPSTENNQSKSGPCSWCNWEEKYVAHFGVKGACIHAKLNTFGCDATAAGSLGYLILQKDLKMPKSWEQTKCLRHSRTSKDCASVSEEKCSFCALPKEYGWYKQFEGFCFQESVMTFNGTNQCANLHDLPEGASDFLASTSTTTRRVPPMNAGASTTTETPSTARSVDKGGFLVILTAVMLSAT